MERSHWRLRSIKLKLPVHIHESRATRGDRKGVVVSIFPGHRAVRGDLDELKLDGLPGWYGNVQEPIREIGIEHWTNRRIKGCSPVAEFYGASRQKNEIANIGLDGVVHCKS